MKNTNTAIFLIGPNGAGKGTIGKKILRDFELPSLEIGAICRKEVQENSKIGQEIAPYMAKGQLAPDSIITPLAINELKSVELMLCDGFPRNLEQAQAILDAGIIPIVFEITISNEEAMRRASNRLYCSKCKRIYTKNNFLPSKIPGICDDDGCVLEQRKDDANPEIVKARLDVYAKKTYPVLDLFKKHNIKVYTIDGSNANAYEQVVAILKNLI